MRRHRSGRNRTATAPAMLMVVALVGVPGSRADADDLKGVYVGGGIGESDTTLDRFPAGASNPANFSGHATGWKALVGLRPWVWAGAELEYVDLGRAAAALCCAATATGSGVPAAVKSSGTALFAVAYLPALAMLDLYGKLGVSHVRIRGDAEAVGVVGVDTCVLLPATLGCRSYRDDRQASGIGWGGGLQIRLRAVSVRAEYERFGTGGVRPGMTSLLAAWNF